MKIALPHNWKPRAAQIGLWNYLQKGGRHAELIAHRRFGKDEVCLHATACAAFKRKASYWHMLPEYSQARKAIWGAINPHTGLRRIDEAFPKELRANTREQEMQIVFKNGSTWQCVGSDNYDSLVGSSPAGIVYSEWALANPNVRAYLKPIINENNGYQIFITTPRGRNHAYTTFKSAQKDPEAYTEIISAETSGVFTKEQLAKELISYIGEFGEDYGRAKFEQEYLCSFEAANLGAILARQIGIAEQQGRVGDHVQFDPLGQHFFISADIGRRDASAFWFWQPKMGGYSIFDYDSGYGLDAEEWCFRLQEKIEKYTLDGHRSALGTIWLPHDAKAKTFAAKHSAVETFIKYFGANNVAITPKSSQANRVNAARVLIPRIEFNASMCEKGIDNLRLWSYEYDEDKKMFSENPAHSLGTDDGDAFSYGCMIGRLFEPKEEKNEKSKQTLTTFDNKVTLNQLWADYSPKVERY